MELKKGSFTFNLGDTSFRRKRLLDDYKILLKELFIFNKDFEGQWNNETQSVFYQRIVQNTDLLEDKNCRANRQDKLARTYTSALYKLGLTDKNRVVSDTGLQYLGELDFQMDNLEKKLSIKKENIIFLRQLLKLRIYDPSNNITFNPFIFLIKMLNKYDYLTKEEFKLIIQSSTGRINYENVLAEFYKVRNKEMSLAKFIDIYFINDDQSCEDTNKFINTEGFDKELFKKIFVNRKTAKSVDIYIAFYLALIKYKDDNNQENLKNLIEQIKKDAIKRAFSTNKIFNTRELNKISIEKFNELYGEIDLLSKTGLEFREAFLERFILSKHEDLINEYIDMTFRVFNLTGIISTKNDKITIGKLYAKEYFKHIDKELNIVLKNDQDMIYNVLSTIQILKSDKTDEVDKLLQNKYNISKNESINDFVKNEEIKAFKDFVIKNFPKEKVIKLLKLIQSRDDKAIFELVTDQTTVPTIFEYILGIAWYHISEYKFNLYDSMNLTLDSSYYPLSHAAGGDGDIVINYIEPKPHVLMLEATLMDINTQKRGELEPVIRHTTNLTIESAPKDVFTIFVANELDNNVVNIFRFCDLIKLESSKQKGIFTDSTKITALKIDEIIMLLKNNIHYNNIYSAMIKEFDNKNICSINNNWRDGFRNNIKKSII